jgi:hypothetical protein
LVATLDDKTQVRGGTADDRQHESEWISMFWHAGSVLFRE